MEIFPVFWTVVQSLVAIEFIKACNLFLHFFFFISLLNKLQSCIITYTFWQFELEGLEL